MVRYIKSYTERIFIEFVGQNSKDQTFGSLYRKVLYIQGPLNRDSTVFIVKLKNFTSGVKIWSSNVVGKIKIFKKVKIYNNHSSRNQEIFEGGSFLGGGQFHGR